MTLIPTANRMKGNESGVRAVSEGLEKGRLMRATAIQHILDNQKPTSRKSVDEYFEVIDKCGTGSINDRILNSQMSLMYLEALIEMWKQQFGSFEIQTVPCLETIGVLCSSLGMAKQVANVFELVEHFPELSALYGEETSKWKRLLEVREKLLNFIAENPDTLQSKISQGSGCGWSGWKECSLLA